MEFMLLIIIMHLLDIGHGTNSAWGVLWMKIISIACINVVLINNNDYIFV